MQIPAYREHLSFRQNQQREAQDTLWHAAGQDEHSIITHKHYFKVLKNAEMQQ